MAGATPKTEHVSDHVYLVVSPNPVWRNRTEARKYEDKDGTVHELKQPQTLHFVKIGDEVNFGDRVSDYNTHNPQSIALHAFLVFRLLSLVQCGTITSLSRITQQRENRRGD